MNPMSQNHSTAMSFVESLVELGVEYVFANLGSDHPGLIEALAEAEQRGMPLPRIIICPHEMSALSAAQGFAMVTGRPQAVFVHTDVGTANLGGAVHNAARSRVPVFIFAGLTPITLEGELKGTRDSYVNYLQDVTDQHSLVRPYVKWSYDLKTGHNVKQLVYRALQIASSSPAGPVYLTASREVLAQQVPPVNLTPQSWKPIEPVALGGEVAQEIIDDLLKAEKPLLVTSYLGRNEQSVPELVQFAERWGIPVVEMNAAYLNFPADHPLHLGYNVDEFIAESDFVIAVDTDVPWVHTRAVPPEEARIYYIDVDPLKEELPLWYNPSSKFIRADSYHALLQLNRLSETLDLDYLAGRKERLKQIHLEQRNLWHQNATTVADVLTVESVCSILNEFISENTILINEAITNSEAIFRYVPRSLPGSIYANGGSSLGWSGGGAIGIKLANPGRDVVSIIGDGSYMLSVPSSTYWLARKYQAPFLAVVLNNMGWNATKLNVLRQYPDGVAQQTDQFWVSLNESADMAGIAEAAGNAFAKTVASVVDFKEALVGAREAIDAGRAAVIDVRLDPISTQFHE